MIGAAVDTGSDPTLDLIQPFQLELANVRGRAVRLGPSLTDILSRHDYPPQVAHVLAEAITVAVLLASLLKYEGIFTLQTKSDGPVSLLVADVTTGGEVRAYARFDADRLPPPGAPEDMRALLGEGYLALTVDQGEHTERYQGIVTLDGTALTDCLDHYFAQSEQLRTSIKLAARLYPEGWRAGGILIQRLPDDDAARIAKTQYDDEDDWLRATLLLRTVAEIELLDRTLDENNLLFRLFHEENVRVFPPTVVKRGCRCSEDRVRQVLQSLPPEDVEELRKDGEITVTCEWCGTPYVIADINAA